MAGALVGGQLGHWVPRHLDVPDSLPAPSLTTTNLCASCLPGLSPGSEWPVSPFLGPTSPELEVNISSPIQPGASYLSFPQFICLIIQRTIALWYSQSMISEITTIKKSTNNNNNNKNSVVKITEPLSWILRLLVTWHSLYLEAILISLIEHCKNRVNWPVLFASFSHTRLWAQKASCSTSQPKHHFQ